jgi:F-type H+-transporting ATPase subunit epsilon
VPVTTRAADPEAAAEKMQSPKWRRYRRAWHQTLGALTDEARHVPLDRRGNPRTGDPVADEHGCTNRISPATARARESAMSTFKVNLVSPEQLLFSEEVDQVDLPGLEGDFGVLAGHAPIVAALRPGIVVILRDANTRQRFVVLGGLAEFSKEELTILADTASTVEEFDLTALMARIDEMQDNLAKISIGEELDRAIEQLDHYKSLHKSLTLTTAF